MDKVRELFKEKVKLEDKIKKKLPTVKEDSSKSMQLVFKLAKRI